MRAPGADVPALSSITTMSACALSHSADHDGAARVVCEVAAGGSQEGASHRTSSSATHHDELGVFGQIDESVRGVALSKNTFDYYVWVLLGPPRQAFREEYRLLFLDSRPVDEEGQRDASRL